MKIEADNQTRTAADPLADDLRNALLKIPADARTNLSQVGFKAAHRLSDVTVVADAGMISEANQVALHAAKLTYILGARIPFLPDVVREWRDKHADEAIPDGLVLTQPWPSTSSEKARGIPDRVIHYQYRHDRARKTLRGIDEQVAKANAPSTGTPRPNATATSSCPAPPRA